MNFGASGTALGFHQDSASELTTEDLRNGYYVIATLKQGLLIIRKAPLYAKMPGTMPWGTQEWSKDVYEQDLKNRSHSASADIPMDSFPVSHVPALTSALAQNGSWHHLAPSLKLSEQRLGQKNMLDAAAHTGSYQDARSICKKDKTRRASSLAARCSGV